MGVGILTGRGRSGAFGTLASYVSSSGSLLHGCAPCGTLAKLSLHSIHVSVTQFLSFSENKQNKHPWGRRTSGPSAALQ